jgi:hypothetical protein
MARRVYEGSAADEREDRKGARAMGVARRDYEKTSRDRAEDRAGQVRMGPAGLRKGGAVGGGAKGKPAFGGKQAPPFGKRR